MEDNTASISRSTLGSSPEHRSGRKRRRRRRKQKEAFNIPGVAKMVLSELAQKIIGCVAGVDVTTENPWTFVSKELVQDNLELHEESSEFLPIRKEVLNFPRQKLLIGYVPDESRDYDEFYICVTEKATDEVTSIIEKMRKEQEERLNNAINKKIKEWTPMGTAKDVDEAILKDRRPRIQVEVETKYPIFPGKVQFKIVPVQKRRDGYMELRSTEETFVNIYKRRIDNAVQVAPRYVSTEAQTDCTYPTHFATQYLYEVDDTQQLLEQCKKSIMDYTNENLENISDILTVNGVMNLYSDDYSSLVLNPEGVWTQLAAIDGIKEYMCFMDVKLCKGKKIANAVWHPMWTGTVAIAYDDAAPNDYFTGPCTEDTVMRAVHGVNPVLIWCTSDALKPKLVLEAPKAVHKLAFCPFDENILIGGCKDGQIIIWDIRHKLNKVEELEVLTTAQQRYRSYMNSLMGWMKNVYDLAVVRPTAISDPRYSHKGPITGITWMSPYHEFTKIGNLDSFSEETDQTSMQFLTSSESGTILIWDLLKKPKIEPGGYKVKKLKRLKKKPSALMADVSPYQSLHLNLKPIYKVYLRRPGDKTKNLAIASSNGKYCRVKYVPRTPSDKKGKLDVRAYYSPVFKRDAQHAVPPTIDVGTMEGDYTLMKWEGQDFDSGEVVNSQVGTLLSYGKYHDGPITSMHYPQSHNLNINLTCGGRIFALWRDDFKDRPVLWRRCKQKLTAGKFNMFKPYTIMTLLMSGHVETWMLASSSKYPISSFMYSSEYITASAIHPLKLKKNIYGAGDRQGAFRLFFVTSEPVESSMNKMKTFIAFLDREVQRKKEFIAWQEEWNARHDGCLKRKEDELRQRKDKEEEERKARAAEIMQEKTTEKQAPKGPQPGKFVEWMIEQKQVEREARIRSMIISKKQLDTKELEKRRKPLQKLEEENEMKKRKQKQRLREGEHIFHNTVAALFPEVVKEKPPPPPDPYAGGDLSDDVQLCYERYKEISWEAQDFVDSHPYKYEFNWRQVLEGGKNRRRQLDDATSFIHKSTLEMKKVRPGRRKVATQKHAADEDDMKSEVVEGIVEAMEP